MQKPATEALVSFREAEFDGAKAAATEPEISTGGKDWMSWPRSQAEEKLNAPDVKTQCRAHFRLGILCAKSKNYPDALDYFHKC